MNNKRCMRCGKEYAPASIKTDDLKKAIENVVNRLNGKDKRITDIIDLCPDCVESFRRWIRRVD